MMNILHTHSLKRDKKKTIKKGETSRVRVVIEAALSSDTFPAGGVIVLNLNLIGATITWEISLWTCLWRITLIVSIAVGKPILTMGKTLLQEIQNCIKWRK